jgi:hypothetical protein
MRETRLSGSEGGGNEPNRFSLPLSAEAACLRLSHPRGPRLVFSAQIRVIRVPSSFA